MNNHPGPLLFVAAPLLARVDVDPGPEPERRALDLLDAARAGSVLFVEGVARLEGVGSVTVAEGDEGEVAVALDVLAWIGTQAWGRALGRREVAGA